MRSELENSIHQVHDVNRVVFSRIEKDMSEMKSFIDKLQQQVQLEGQPMFPGTKKCFGGARMFRYQERLQKLGTGGQPGEDVVVNECKA